jgi:hypothetical protein
MPVSREMPNHNPRKTTPITQAKNNAHPTASTTISTKM